MSLSRSSKALFLVGCFFLAATVVGGDNSSTLLHPSQTSATKAPGTDTGEKIATIVKAAVDTAFPIFGKIIDLFKTKKPDEKTTQADVEKALKKAQADYDAKAKEAVRPVAQVSDELKVIEIFAAGSVKASLNVNTMRAILATESPNFDKLRVEWAVAESQLADSMKVTADQIKAVREATLRAKIIDLQGSKKDLILRIEANLDPKMPASEQKEAIVELREQLKAMGELLKGFDSIGAAELSMLQDEISGVVKWANGAAELQKKYKQPDPELMDIANRGIESAQNASQPRK